MRSSHRPLSRGRGRRAIVQPSARLGGSPDVGRGGRGISNDHDRRMEHIASVSRSSGLEKDGDS